MDFLLDFVSVNALWTVVLIIHALLAVALIGALTHQAMSVLAPVQGTASSGGILTRFRAVQGSSYAGAVCALWMLTFLVGALIYTKYRLYVGIPLEQEGFWKTLAAFELKKHMASIGLGLLPIYWYFWKNPYDPEFDGPRKWLTVCLAGMVWYMFLVGHVVNNVLGFGS
jgi:hypothetical protein